MERLRSAAGIDGAGDLGDLLMEVTDKRWYRKATANIFPTCSMSGTALEGLDDFNVEVLFRNTLRASVQYAVLSAAAWM
ncbi:MAG: hypothetical protein ACLRJV_08205 [Eubacteriales bacterium]